MSMKSGIAIAIVCLVVVGLVAIFVGTAERNDNQNWQILQSVFGKVSVINEAGWYPKWFGKVWTYPRYLEYRWNADPKEGEAADESIRVTFNDGGTAQVSAFVRAETPVTDEARKTFHQQFAGDLNAVKGAIRAHLSNCSKASAPLMSASENQASRKSEFSQVIEEQLSGGLYEMRRVERALPDRLDEKGKPVMVGATEIQRDNEGKAIIAVPSPLKGYHVSVTQFSVTDIDYDEATRKQFAAKKESYLAAEQSKAQREQEVQARLMIIEKFLKEKAEVEGEANKVKAKAVIEAQQKADVATQIKVEQETQAQMRQSVAAISKQEEQAKLEAAQLAAQRIKVTAEAEKQAIELAGKMTEVEQYKLDNDVKKIEALAKYLPQLQMPSVIMNGSNGNGQGGSTTDNLINITLMRELGLMDSANVNKSSVKDRINRQPIAETPTKK